jgi:hypothetical protein
MIIKRYRNGKIVTEHIGEGEPVSPKTFTKSDKVITNPRGIPRKTDTNTVIPKRKGCGCGKKK